MDRHEQFLTHKTSEVKQLLRYTSANLSSTTCLFTLSSKVVQDSYKYSNSLQLLETLRTILCLCYQYQDSRQRIAKYPFSRKFYSDESKKQDVFLEQNIIAFDQLDIDKMKSSLDNQLKKKDFSNLTEVSVVLDILVLHMTLYHKVSDIVQSLNGLQNLIYQRLEEHNELTIFQIKLMDCYIDGLLLHKERASIIDELESEKVTALYLQNLQLWLKSKVLKNYDLLVVILPKLVKLVSAGGILKKVWDMIMASQNSAKTLSMLHLTADIWFSIESEHIEELVDQSVEERLWLLLLKELSSSLPQQRKPALQLTKKVADLIDRHRTEILQFPNYQELRPLVCTGNYYQQAFFKENLKNWFLILEELEEDKEHLVTPVFERLKYMSKETSDIHGIHIAWIRCAFARILQDNYYAIVKWGLLEVFTLDLELYNDEFLSLVLNALNNTHFYENDMSEEKPTVVKELAIFLNYGEANNTDLVTRFMVKASKMTWEPIPLFYSIHALSMVTKVKSVWKETELEAVKSLAEVNLTMDCSILRVGSQIELLEAMTHFATESLDLIAVAKTLSAFPTSEALIRGQLAWKRTSAWLSKLVKKDEAVSFLEKICGQIASENSQKDISMKSLSLIIMLLHDGGLLLNSKSCPGLATLRNLLNCLIDTTAGPHDNSELENRSIELIHHLLDLTKPKDLIIYEFISNYADASLRFTFRILRHISDEALFENIDTYVRVTQKFFTAESLVITKPEIFNHIERFETESLNIIEDKHWSNNVRRYFGIRILHSCLTSTSLKLRNYKFIRPLCKAYKIPMTQPANRGVANNSQNAAGKLKDKIASEYYKFVAQLFCDYLEDEPVDDWLSDINWIEEVTYLIQVGGKDIFTPLVEMLSQIFFKEVLRPTDIDDFKSVVRLCWKSTLESKECWVTTERIVDLIFSSPFLECVETRALTIECTHEMIKKGEKIPELRVILLRGLKRLKGEYLSHFYDAVLTCLLHGRIPDRDKEIEQRACSYVLKCYQEVYPNYLSNMNTSTDVAVRAHAVTLLHKMITDDPTHGERLLPAIIVQLMKTETMKEWNVSASHRRMSRILQVLLVLQPMLQPVDIEILHDTLLRDNIFSEDSQSNVTLMREWLLIRVYLDNESLRAKIWDFFDQSEEEQADGICSVLTIVYHVARLLSTDLQLDFINAAFQHIMPCYMSDELKVRLNARAVTSKLYDLASEKGYSTVTEKYKELYTALTKSLKRGNPTHSSIRLELEFNFTVFDPINDYSLQTLFYELPRLSNVSSDEYIPPELLEKFGFKEANSHPLKLLNLMSDVSEVEAVVPVLRSSRNEGLELIDSDGSEDW